MSDLLPLLESISSRLGQIENHLGLSSGGSGGGSGGGGGDDSPSVRAFDAYCRDCLEPFMAACKELGGGAEVASQFVQNGWDAQRQFLCNASQAKKPDQGGLMNAMLPITTVISEAGNSIPRDDWENHFKTVSGLTP